MKRDKSLKEKIEYFIYILQYVLLGVIIILFLGLVFVLGFSCFYGLTKYLTSSIIGMVITGLAFYQCLTFAKFKELREKFKKVNKK